MDYLVVEIRDITFCIAGLIIFSFVGNSLVLYNLMLGKDSLGKKRSKTLFLHLALADVMVTLFPMAGEERDTLHLQQLSKITHFCPRKYLTY